MISNKNYSTKLLEHLPSSPKLQSLSTSQSHDIGIHRPDSGHRYIDSSHTRSLQCSPSSLPSIQSGVRSLNKYKRITIDNFRSFLSQWMKFKQNWLTIAMLMGYSLCHQHTGSNWACKWYSYRLCGSSLHQRCHHLDSHFLHLMKTNHNFEWNTQILSHYKTMN